MDLEHWWPKLSPSERQWLIDHNGEALSGALMSAITDAGGALTGPAWWVESDPGPSGVFLSDEAVDWIEAVANGEQPTARR